MHLRHCLTTMIAIAPILAHADAITDLRTTLAALTATNPARGTFEVTSISRNNEEDQPDPGKATVDFEVADAGMRILYPMTTLTQARQEARLEAADPDRQTPARTGIRQVHPLQLYELLDAAATLNIALENSQLIAVKPSKDHGAARVMLLKVTPKLSKGSSKHVKKLESNLSIWLAEDGVPVAAERTVTVIASFLFVSFENDRKENWTYARAGDRLLSTRYEESQKEDGLGQHGTSHTTAVLRLMP